METVEFNQIRIDHNGEWCQVLWRKLGGSGNRYRMIILSSYGDWSYQWSIGGDSLPRFLAKLELYYMGRKLIDHDGFKEYDQEATSAAVVLRILRSRREKSIDDDDAREYYDMASAGLDLHDFHHICRESDFDDLWELEEWKPCNTWTAFWKYLWVPAVVPALLEADSEVMA